MMRRLSKTAMLRPGIFNSCILAKMDCVLPLSFPEPSIGIMPFSTRRILADSFLGCCAEQVSTNEKQQSAANGMIFIAEIVLRVIFFDFYFLFKKRHPHQRRRSNSINY